LKPLKSIHRVMLHSKAAEAIAEYIEENHLLPGDKLPSERSLAEQLTIGRNSVREALRSLEASGVIEVRNGLGAFVCEKKTTSVINIKLNKTRNNLLELLETRYALEMHAIELCIRNISDEEIARAGGFLEESKRAILLNLADQHSPDAAFHRVIYTATRNKTLCELLIQVDILMTDIWSTLQGNENMHLATLPFHEALYEALKERSLRKAQQAVIDILRTGGEFILNAKSTDQEMKHCES
jgi:GntR family transcriptional repressor for pyruvate dehydrogenase complex